MQGDVAAIVDIGAIELRRLAHRGEDFLGDRAGDRRHRRDETVSGKWRHGRVHAPRDDALDRGMRWNGGLAQLGKLGTQLVEQGRQAPTAA